MDTEECKNELQLINLRNEVTHQITVDTCGERCAQLDDFNWVRPTDEWNEESDTPESEIDTPHSGDGAYLNTSDSSSAVVRWSLRRDLREAVRQQCPGKSAATECPDGGQYFSDGHKSRVRRSTYRGF